MSEWKAVFPTDKTSQLYEGLIGAQGNTLGSVVRDRANHELGGKKSSQGEDGLHGKEGVPLEES